MLAEILCAIPYTPYESLVATAAATARSIGASPGDYHCVAHYKWDDEVSGAKNRTVACTMTANQTSAEWITSGYVQCIGMPASL